MTTPRAIVLSLAALALAATTAAASPSPFVNIEASADARLFAGQAPTLHDDYSFNQLAMRIASTGYLQTSGSDAPSVPAARMSTRWDLTAHANTLDFSFSAATIHRTTAPAPYQADFSGLATIPFSIASASDVRIQGLSSIYGLTPADSMSTHLRLIDAAGRTVLEHSMLNTPRSSFALAATLAPGRYALTTTTEFHERFGPTAQPNAMFASFELNIIPNPGTLATLAAALCVATLRRRAAR
jgi:hypothetical protein